MKVVELRAERAKIYDSFERECNYYSSTDNQEIFFNGKVRKTSENVLKENYERDKALLEKLDKINNILMESDANTYIDVHGKHLSIATARIYLSELDAEHYFKRAEYNGCDEMFSSYISCHTNLQSDFYDRCWVGRDETVLLDPMRLKEKKAEYCAKETSWGYDLLTKVLISDATTEVSFIE